MNLFDSFVEDALRDKNFLEIERGGFESDEVLGLIYQESEEFLCLKRFSDEGEYDGFVVIRKDDVLNIKIGGNKKTVIEESIVKDEGFDLQELLNLSTIRSIVESISTIFGYVTLYQEEYTENFYIGEVLEIDDDFLVLHEYGTRSTLDRSKSLLRLDSISRVEVDGKYERSILKSFLKKK